MPVSKTGGHCPQVQIPPSSLYFACNNFFVFEFERKKKNLSGRIRTSDLRITAVIEGRKDSPSLNQLSYAEKQTSAAGFEPTRKSLWFQVTRLNHSATLTLWTGCWEDGMKDSQIFIHKCTTITTDKRIERMTLELFESSAKIGTIQRRLACPAQGWRKKSRMYHFLFFFFLLKRFNEKQIK